MTSVSTIQSRTSLQLSLELGRDSSKESPDSLASIKSGFLTFAFKVASLSALQRIAWEATVQALPRRYNFRGHPLQHCEYVCRNKLYKMDRRSCIRGCCCFQNWQLNNVLDSKNTGMAIRKSNFRNHHAVGVPAVSGSDHEGGGPAKAAIFSYRTNVGAENPELDGGDDRPLFFSTLIENFANQSTLFMEPIISPGTCSDKASAIAPISPQIDGEVLPTISASAQGSVS